jgi:toxin ParE1/3/4
MKHDVVVEPDAELDVVTASDWYEAQRPGLGAAFELSVDATLERIARMPELAGLIHKDVRRRSIPKYPFGVFYRIEAQSIRVLAVMHTSRDPHSWQSRA